MDWGDGIWVAVGLVFVIEGLLPLVSPTGWRRMFVQFMQLRDGQIRFIALLGVAIGVAMLVLA
ncbi:MULTISPECIES: DUF2065 domain-containing protein [unclassified Simplicispira]|jgi:uncharacterized protein YjeT (DUF2065 family)|uniref:DUF2065 domain-containing protein n=1 Tax=unclassified Simplicispira TaxID=2630407 RepID=UPI000D5CF56A|nr:MULTISPECIES: DUF2065 domain-containing protein [unclassified Simplicispira]MBH1977681.1 DUF2065 domain-containing protein [Comamonadaceae bacterium]PVY55422.1 hypothetical protein C8D04_0611 [Simplicispira sp. 125]REG16365.1 hypothetical protein C8D01_0920 [Simplicispira sp. 110]